MKCSDKNEHAAGISNMPTMKCKHNSSKIPLKNLLLAQF
jgi:hypothetical protein